MSAPAAGRPARIALIIGNLETGGTQVLLMELMRRLDRTRFEPHLVSLKDTNHFADEIAANKWPFSKVRVTRSYRPGQIAALAAELRRIAPDVVHCQSDHANFAGRPAAHLAGIGRIIAHFHNTYEHRINQGFLALESLCRPLTTMYLSCSEGVREFTNREGFTTGRPNLHVQNGIDLSRFEAAGENRAEAREKFGIAPEVFHILHTARLEPHKQPQVLIEAVIANAKQLGNFRLTFVGDGSMRGALEKRVSEASATPTDGGVPLADRIIFVGWSTEVPQWVAAADVLVLVSKNEGFALSLVEAMAAGTPVIAPRVIGPSEVLRDGEFGILVDDPQPNSIGAELLRLKSDQPLRDKLSAAGRARAKEFSIEQFVHGMESVYEQLMKQPPNSARKSSFRAIRDKILLWRISRAGRASARARASQ